MTILASLALFHVFVLVYEEPSLRAGFGFEYNLSAPEYQIGLNASLRGEVGLKVVQVEGEALQTRGREVRNQVESYLVGE